MHTCSSLIPYSCLCTFPTPPFLVTFTPIFCTIPLVQMNSTFTHFDTDLNRSQMSCGYFVILTLNPLTWKIWWAPNNASIWQMGFNSAFEGLNRPLIFTLHIWCLREFWSRILFKKSKKSTQLRERKRSTHHWQSSAFHLQSYLTFWRRNYFFNFSTPCI